jgi:hypothetical protein
VGRLMPSQSGENPKKNKQHGSTNIPVRYELSNQVTWNEAAAFCGGREGGLCARSELCPLVGQELEGDHFVPTSANDTNAESLNNSWLSIGSLYPKRTCKLHHEFASTGPSWGLDGTQKLDLRGTVFCCGENTPSKPFCKAEADIETVLNHITVSQPHVKKSPRLLCMVIFILNAAYLIMLNN